MWVLSKQIFSRKFVDMESLNQCLLPLRAARIILYKTEAVKITCGFVVLMNLKFLNIIFMIADSYQVSTEAFHATYDLTQL